jgi:hypothetical protein
MRSKAEISRITLDVPKALHKKLKTQAALQGKSMRGIILDALKLTEACRLSDHVPNKITRKAIKDAQNERNLTRAKNIQDLVKKLDI